MKRPFQTALALFLLAQAGAWAASADRIGEASSGKCPDPGDLVLFPMDDVSIPWRENLRLALERPVRDPANPVMRGGPVEGVDGYGALAYGTVIEEEGKLRLWYVASPRSDSRIPGDVEAMEHYRPVAYAESTDGLHWRRPDLGLVEFRGSRHNNLVRIDPSNEPYSRGCDFIAVLRDAADPDPARRYKMAYITYDPARASATTATAISRDGLRWQLANTAMFTQGHFENTSLIRFGGLYYLAGQNIPWHDAELADGSPAGRVMKVFFSPDFQHWSSGRALAFARPGADLRAFQSKPANRGEENHMGAGLWNRGNVVIGLYGRWHGGTIAYDPARPEASLRGLKIDLGLVISDDGIHYREPVRDFVEVPRGGPDDWDSEAILQANAFANTATETLIWYSHWDTSRPDEIPPLPEALPEARRKRADSIGLLRLPRDRFGAFLPLGSGAASCLTKPIRLSRASRLSFNADRIDPAAPLRIDLVDETETPLSGFQGRAAASALKSPVAWAGGDRPLPAGSSFRIKVTWPAGSRARLYALYLEHD